MDYLGLESYDVKYSERTKHVVTLEEFNKFKDNLKAYVKAERELYEGKSSPDQVKEYEKLIS